MEPGPANLGEVPAVDGAGGSGTKRGPWVGAGGGKVVGGEAVVAGEGGGGAGGQNPFTVNLSQASLPL